MVDIPPFVVIEERGCVRAGGQFIRRKALDFDKEKLPFVALCFLSNLVLFW